MEDEPTETGERLAALMADEQVDEAATLLRSLHPGETAHLVLELPEEDREKLLLALPPEVGADVLEELPDDVAAATVRDMSPDDAARMVQEMRTDEEVDLLGDLPPAAAEAILAHVDDADAVIARDLLRHAEDSAGGLMQTEFIAIPKGMVAGEVVRQLRDKAAEYADYPASYLYVLDEAGCLDGVVSLRALLLCDEATPIWEIKHPSAVSLRVDTAREELVRVFRTYHYLAIPVVDGDGKLVGVVTQDDAMRLAGEEAEGEMLKFAGIVGGEELRDMPFHLRSRRRLSWLSINILLNVLAASVIAAYQETLEAAIAIAVFLPIISDMSGCSGNQAVAVSIRELSLDRIEPRHALWVLGKEVTIGLLNGLVLGLIIGLVAWAWKGNAVLGLLVGGALWINTIFAVMLGGLVPLLLRRLNQDPALASGPILTTLTDAAGFFLMLALATRFLHLL